MFVTIPRRCWDGCSACQTVRTAGWHSALHPGWSHTGVSGPPDNGKARAVTQSSWIKQGSIIPWPSWVHSNGSSPPHLLCPGWMTNVVPGLSKESDLSPPGDQAMGSGRQCCASAPAQFLSVNVTICQLRFKWAWYAARHLCQQKWELWTCNTAEEFLIPFWRVHPAVLLLTPARAPSLIISPAASTSRSTATSILVLKICKKPDSWKEHSPTQSLFFEFQAPGP